MLRIAALLAAIILACTPARATLGPDKVHATSLEMGAAGTSDTTITRSSAGVIAVEGVDIPSLSAANIWTAAQSISLSTAGNNLSLITTDAGATGSTFKCQHDSATPAAADIACSLQVFAGADDEEIGQISYVLVDGSTTSEDGYFKVNADVAGTTAHLGGFGSTGAANTGLGGVNAIGPTDDIFPQFTGGNGIGAGDALLAALENSLEVISPATPAVYLRSSTNTEGVVIAYDSTGDDLRMFFEDNGTMRSNSFFGLHEVEDSAGASSVAMVVTAETDGATGPRLIFNHDSSSPAAADELVTFSAHGFTSTGGELDYARMSGIIVSPTNGAASGGFLFSVEDGSASLEPRVLISDSLVASAAATIAPVTGLRNRADTTSFQPVIQATDNSIQESSMSMVTYNNAAASSPQLWFGKSGTTTQGTHALVTAADELGCILWSGSDGTDWENAAGICSLVDTTASANDMPGSLVFYTSLDGATVPAARMIIKNNGTTVLSSSSLASTTPLVANVGGAFGTFTPTFQVQGATSNTATLMVASVGAVEPRMVFAHSRNATPGTYTTIAQDGDDIEWSFQAADGNELEILAKIRAIVDAASGVDDPGLNDMPGALQFQTTPDGGNDSNQALTINNQQKVFVGLDGQANDPLDDMAGWNGGTYAPQFQVIGNGTNETTGIGIYSSGNDATAPVLFFGKSRTTGNFDYDLVADNDFLGEIHFQGSDNTNMMRGASIIAKADGTTGDGTDMPTELMFNTTPDGSETPLLRLTIKPDGGVFIGDEESTSGSGGRGSLTIMDSTPGSGAGGSLRLGEDSSGGVNTMAIIAPATITGDLSCTLINQANFIPYHCVGSTQPTVTVNAATTFAVTTSQIVLACTGAESIDTITGGVIGMRLLILHTDTECTINDDDDATASNAVDLTGTATADVGAVNKVIELIYNGSYWLQVSESDN